MWNSIVNAAKAVYHLVVPKAPTVKTGNAGGLTVKPIKTQSTLSVQPYTNPINRPGVTVKVLTPAQVSRQQQASLTVQASRNQTAAAFAAQRVADQKAAATQTWLQKAGGIAAKLTTEAGYAIMHPNQARKAPGNWIAGANIKQQEGKALTSEAANFENDQKRWQNTESMQIQDLNRRYNDSKSTMSYADYSASYDRITKGWKGLFDNRVKDYTDRAAALDQPVAGQHSQYWANGVSAFSGSAVGSIFKAGFKMLGMPRELLAKAQGHTDNRIISPHQLDGLKVPFGAISPAGVITDPKQLQKLREYNAWLLDQGIDYATLGGAFKAGGKAAEMFTAKFGKPAWELLKASKVGQAGEAFGQVFKGSKFGQAASWLGKEYVSPIAKIQNAQAARAAAKFEAAKPFAKTVQTIGRKMAGFKPGMEARATQRFSGLTDQELHDWQVYMNTKGQTTLSPKVQKWADEYTARYNRMYKSNQAAGLKFKQRAFYRPTVHDTPLRLEPSKPPKNSLPGFARPRVAQANDVYNREQLIQLEAKREMAHVSAQAQYTGKLHPMEAYGKAYGKAKAMRNLRNLQGQAEYAKVPSLVKSYNRSVGGMIHNVISAPNRVWKSAVLKYSPTWYENNFVHNTAVQGLAGGVKSYAESARLIRHPSWLKALPSDVVSKSGGFGSWVENLARGGAYRAQVAKGASHTAAVTKVNKYLFDYKSIKNWERPIRSVVPFWRWQKNATRLSAELPFQHPMFTHSYGNVIEKYQTKPLQDIPADQRDFYKDKLFYGGKWHTSAGLPLSPEQLNGVGINPAFQFLTETALGHDHFGRSTNTKSWGDRIAGMTAPTNLADKFLHRNDKTAVNWLSPSGYSKRSQGYDAGAPGYDPTKNNSQKAVDQAMGYMGLRSYSTFDKGRADEDNRFKKFMTEYTATDWASLTDPFKVAPTGMTTDQSKAWYAKQDQAYKAKDAARTAMATKYGFDLNKDIYNGKFSKWDTQTTIDAKALSQRTNKAQTAVYDEFARVATASNGRDAYSFIAKVKDAVAGGKDLTINGHTYKLADLPRFTAFPREERSAVNTHVATSQFWSKYWTLDKAGQSKMMKDNPQYATAGKGASAKAISFRAATASGNWTNYVSNYGSATARFWQKYYATTDLSARRAMLAANPGMSKVQVDPKKAQLAWAYQNLPPDVRNIWIKQNGLADPTKAKWTKAQWAADALAKHRDPASLLAHDTATFSGFGSKVAANQAGITAGLRHKPRFDRKKITYGSSFQKPLTKKH